MNGGPNRRFPRTARAMSQVGSQAESKTGTTIERDKIRHRRAKDQLFDVGDELAERHDPPLDDGGAIIIGDADQGWDDEGTEPAGDPSWDDEPGDAWEDEGLGSFSDSGDDDSGIVWEADAFPADDDDDLTFGQVADDIDPGPEVELAGRRDVRPKPPRPLSQPRPIASRAKQQAPAPQQYRHSPGRPGGQRQGQSRPRQIEPDRMELDDQIIGPDHGGQGHGFSRDHAHDVPSRENGRFARTRATHAGPPGGDEQVLQRQRRTTPKRRRQEKTAPGATTSRRARRGRTGFGKRSIAVVFLALLSVGGWFVYQQGVGPDGLGPWIERAKQILPLPESPRTADDTPFNETEASDQATAEKALSDLEQRIRDQSPGAGDAAPGDQEANPATIGTEGPPVPAFKPLNELPPSAPATQAAANDGPQLAANGGNQEAVNEPSLFEQLWRYLTPG